jgi:hypothetical protein
MGVLACDSVPMSPHEFRPAPMIARLERFPPMLTALVAGMSGQDADRSPAPGVWSIREVVLHLLLEEREDFRPRLESVLADPAAPWHPIDPEAGVRNAIGAAPQLAELLEHFRSERAESVAWLRSRDEADWSATYAHPRGDTRAGDVLSAWAAHDLLHARQIIKRLYEHVGDDARPFETGYAGEWGR